MNKHIFLDVATLANEDGQMLLSYLEDFINHYQKETYLQEISLSESRLTISYAQNTTLIEIVKEINL